MQVFARLDAAGRPAAADRTRQRLGPLGYQPLPLSSQSVYSAEDILSLLEPHALAATHSPLPRVWREAGTEGR
jgi:hypothetical protein